MLLKNQRNISGQRGMPIDDVGASSAIETITGETVQLYYWNSGVRTIDAGQAAGTVVEGVLIYDNIKNSAGTMAANKINTSLSFTAGALTTEVEIDETLLESLDDVAGADRATALTNGLSNGQYVVDYTTGTIYGKKASTATNLANTTYKIKVEQVGTSGSAVSSNVNLAKVAGTATSVGAGVVGTGVQRVTLASDDPAVTALAAANASLDGIEEVLEDVHDDPANLLRVAEQDPLNYAFQPETVVAVTNGADDTYSYYVDLATFRKGAIQLLLDGGSGSVTVTLEGTCQDDGTAPASCNYVDITNALFGSANFTASNILFDEGGFFAGLKYLKIKVVASTGGANDADWTIMLNKVW